MSAMESLVQNMNSIMTDEAEAPGTPGRPATTEEDVQQKAKVLAECLADSVELEKLYDSKKELEYKLASTCKAHAASIHESAKLRADAAEIAQERAAKKALQARVDQLTASVRAALTCTRARSHARALPALHLECRAASRMPLARVLTCARAICSPRINVRGCNRSSRRLDRRPPQRRRRLLTRPRPSRSRRASSRQPRRRCRA